MQCPICMEDYDLKQRHPMILGCGHSLCQKCIKTMYNTAKNNIQCPFDKQNSKFNSLQQVTKNYSFINLLEGLQHQQKDLMTDEFCAAHPTEKPIFLCCEDGIMICQFCLLKEHKNHRFESAQPISRGKIALNKIYDAKHNYNQWIELTKNEIQVIFAAKISTQQEINKLYISIENRMCDVKLGYLEKNEELHQ